jgi:GMP synthase-like glutamine amidotransferase
MIGILNAYHFDPTPGSYQEEYTRLIVGFAEKVFPGETVRDFKVAQGQWPKSIDECKVWIISGSPKAAYDPDPWIAELKKFIVLLDAQKKKLIGICFGHQVISAALGGEVIQSPKGWGVGVRTFSVVQPQAWMRPPLKQVSLLFSHQDQVVSLPNEAKLLAQDEFCGFQMYQLGNHILTLQGHPEFSVAFARARLISRKDKMPKEVFEKALQSFDRPKDDQALIEWIRNFVASSPSF